MATARRQRIGILVIVIALVVGTIGSFIVMILSTQTSQEDARKQQAAMQEYQKLQDEYSKKVDARNISLSKQHYPEFKQYASYPAKFSIDSVKSLVKKTSKSVPVK